MLIAHSRQVGKTKNLFIMKIFKRILAVLCWTLIAGGVISLFTNSANGMFPMSLALIVLLFRWGKDLWVVDPETAHIKGWVKSLIFIGIHIGLVVVCGLIGITISMILADGDSSVTNWIFLLTIFFVGLWLTPKRFLPKKKDNREAENATETKTATNE